MATTSSSDKVIVMLGGMMFLEVDWTIYVRWVVVDMRIVRWTVRRIVRWTVGWIIRIISAQVLIVLLEYLRCWCKRLLRGRHFSKKLLL